MATRSAWTLAKWLFGRLRRHGVIIVILPVFAALGILYSIKTPIFEVLGEPWHYAYVKQLADGRGLPSVLASGERWEQGEAYEPPLYYALGALLTRSVKAGPAETSYERNPFAVIPQGTGLDEAKSTGNKNVVLHLGDESYPFQGVVLSVRVLRWFSILCSMVTIVLVYLIGIELAPGRRVYAAGAAALLAFTPQFIFFSAGVSNNALATMLATLALYMSLRVCGGKARPYRTPILLGLVVGLATLTHMSGLATTILVPYAYACSMVTTGGFSRQRLWKNFGRPVLVAWAIAAAVGGWWYARNATLYHDPSGMHVMQAIVGSRQQPLSLREALTVIINTVSSYWGIFGWANVLADDLFYTLVRILAGIGILGLAIFLARIYWRRKTFRGYRWPGVGLLGLWAIMMMLILLHQTFFVVTPQTSLLYPALASFAFFSFVGLTAWVPEHYTGALGALIVVMFLAVSCITPFRYIIPAYAQPTRIALEQVPSDMQDLDVYVGDDLFLLGYELREDSTQVGQDLHLRLYWLAKRAMSRDYAFRISLLGRQAQVIGKVETYPGGGNLPTRLWLPGEVVGDDYVLPIPRDALAPTAGTLRVGVFTWPDRKSVHLVDAQKHDIGEDIEVARVRIVPAIETLSQSQQSVQANYGDKITLTGYDLYPRSPSAGESWEIVLHWKAMARMSQDYTVFIHLLNSAGQKVAQLDEQPLAGDYPTRFWRDGESIRDVHQLQLPPGLPAGDYRLEMGFYLLESGERLPIINSEATYVTLDPVYIKGK